MPLWSLPPTVPCDSPVAVDVTIGVPFTVVDLNVTVATPVTADLLVVFNSVPVPDMLKVIEFVAVVTVRSEISHIFDVISDVAVPFASIDDELDVFSTFTGTDVVVIPTVP